MGSFLKKILEPSEQDTFDSLTGTETPFISILEALCSEDVLPSANVGLPSPLIPRQPPGPAYVTHTGPLVRMLLQQDRLGRAATARPAEPQSAGAPEQPPARRRAGSTARAQGDSQGIPKEKGALTAPGACHRIVFARRPPLAVLPRSSQA